MSAQKHWRCTSCGAETYHGAATGVVSDSRLPLKAVSKDTVWWPFCHMQAGVKTPEVGGCCHAPRRSGVSAQKHWRFTCCGAETYQVASHCSGILELLPLKAVCLSLVRCLVGTHCTTIPV